MDGQNFQNEQNTVEQSVQPTNNYQDYTNYTADVQPQTVVVEEPKQNNTLAVVSLVLGILSIVLGCCIGWVGILFAIGGIVCAVLSKKNGKSGMATAGLICSIVGILLGLLVTIFSVLFSMALYEELSY